MLSRVCEGNAAATLCRGWAGAERPFWRHACGRLQVQAKFRIFQGSNSATTHSNLQHNRARGQHKAVDKCTPHSNNEQAPTQTKLQPRRGCGSIAGHRKIQSELTRLEAFWRHTPWRVRRATDCKNRPGVYCNNSCFLLNPCNAFIILLGYAYHNTQCRPIAR